MAAKFVITLLVSKIFSSSLKVTGGNRKEILGYLVRKYMSHHGKVENDSTLITVHLSLIERTGLSLGENLNKAVDIVRS